MWRACLLACSIFALLDLWRQCIQLYFKGVHYLRTKIFFSIKFSVGYIQVMVCGAARIVYLIYTGTLHLRIFEISRVVLIRLLGFHWIPCGIIIRG